MALIRTLQTEMSDWQRTQFGDATVAQAALGMAEEMGEVARLVLKHTQNHRGLGDPKVFGAELSKELGDVFIYMTHVASLAGISLEEAIVQKWDTVQQRIRLQDDETRKVASGD